MAVEQLGKPSNRQLLETLLTKLAGRPARLKFELLDEALLPPPMDEPKRAPAAASGSANERASEAGARASTGAEDAVASFKNDPMIQKALKLFEGEIKAVQPPTVGS